MHGNMVDILVDLKGYTTGGRMQISALRPAPVQVSYLGFPGTTGADFFDYIITDRIVTPQNQAPYYSEKFVYLPHCYQVNDHAQVIAEKEWTKTRLGLPENSIVFCSFNQGYKIDPTMFNVWMKILTKVPDSVLWLSVKSKTAKENLRQEAKARDVNPERLLFAERLPKQDHLARLALADLALDTRIYNGHTTSSDSLWAGVPVITLQGNHFASRVSSSILRAIGLPELITKSMEEYEALAVKLALKPEERQAIRVKIAMHRFKAPLFDTPRFVKNLEKAYKEMWNIFAAGEEPRRIELEDV
jgi:predicted O-linked N-acetylglucosamine transferase (SPINDLY family)